MKNTSFWWGIGLFAATVIAISAIPDHRQVVLTDETGEHRLVYSGNFTPQARTADDMAILSRAAAAVAQDATQQGDSVTMQTLLSDVRFQNIRDLERTVVEYRMQHPEKRP